MTGSNLKYADLQGATLKSAKMTNIILTGAYFGFADLTGVDLMGVDLTGAKSLILPTNLDEEINKIANMLGKIETGNIERGSQLTEDDDDDGYH